MKTIAVTGATSMIGSALTASALRDGAEVWAIVRENSGRMDRLPPAPGLHVVFYKGLEYLKDIRDIPADCGVFYHLAWAGTGKKTRDEPHLHAPNISYTLQAVELAKRLGCRRFVGVGSQAELVSPEGKGGAAATAYGICKHTALLLSRKRCAQLGMEHVWGRVFSVYGPHDKDWTMITTGIGAALAGETVRFSSGRQKWNYIYETDAGELLYRLGKESVPAGEYPIAGTENRPLRDYTEEMMRALGEGAVWEYGADAPGSGGVEADASETYRVTGFTPGVSFETGIRETIAFLKAMQKP